MLHLKTVEPKSFSILRELLEIKELQDFSLVGGTALSLLYGHRLSLDLDLFSNIKFNNDDIVNGIKKKIGSDFNVRTATNFGIFGFIGKLKIDIIRFPHPLIRPTIEIEGIRMYSPEDIVAMKVQAILGRGKKKDFWDINELLNHFTVEDFINFHHEKYITQNLLISVPAVMTYFDDADEDENPISLKGQTWESVKKNIQKKVRMYLR